MNPNNGIVNTGKFLHCRRGGGKTNSHFARNGDLDVDLETDRVYFTGQGFFAIDDRLSLNINGQLTGNYAGKPDQTIVTFSGDLKSRHLWAEFSKDSGSGVYNKVAVRGDKVVYVAQTNRGSYITTDNASQSVPFNAEVEDKNLAQDDIYLALWDKDIEETANLDEKTFPFIPDDTCFRLDDIPCEDIVYNPDYPEVEDRVEASIRFNTRQKATSEREGEIATLSFEWNYSGVFQKGSK